MDFAYSPRVQELRQTLLAFMDEHVLPADATFHAEVEAGRYPLTLLDGLKEKARALGLWNLFLPGLRDAEPGRRPSNVEYAPPAEIRGRIPWA
ncbi:hypothetical protein WDZ92_33655, partial [Nostoc sp. NIES-2111]